MMKTKRRGVKRKEGPTLLNLKVTEREKAKLNAQAKRYAHGNLSAWLRFAGLRYKPIKFDFPR